MRKFKLINSLGQTFDLMRKDAFFNSPDGLGFQMDQEFARIGSTYQLIETQASQKKPSGEMVFKSYEVYKEFTQFIAHIPLKLAYMPSNEWYYLDCTVSKLSKSEISRNNRRLICDIDFVAQSKWYIPRIGKRTSAEISNPKKYKYKYPYTYTESVNGIIDLFNAGSEECPCIIHIFGPIINPQWSLIVNGVVNQSGSISETIKKDNKLVINSKDNELEIAEYTRDNIFVKNHYQNSDFEKENFILIPVGKSTLTVAGTTSSEVVAYIEVIETYETI